MHCQTSCCCCCCFCCLHTDLLILVHQRYLPDSSAMVVCSSRYALHIDAVVSCWPDLIHGCVLCHCCGEQRLQAASNPVVAITAKEDPGEAPVTEPSERLMVLHSCYFVQRVLVQEVSPPFGCSLQPAHKNFNTLFLSLCQAHTLLEHPAEQPHRHTQLLHCCCSSCDLHHASNSHWFL